MKLETWLLDEAGIRLIDGDRGKNYPKQSDFTDEGYCLFLSAKNVTVSGFQFTDTIFIEKDRHELLRAGTLERQDIVMTTRGTIGNVAFYDSNINYPKVRINSGMIIIRPDLELWNPRFLYYVLTSSFIQNQILSLTSGSAVPQLPARDLKQFKLPKLPLIVQNKIESIISSIEDKIQLNQQINQTLEEMAQALFKSWFVDFEPTKAKIAALAAGSNEEDANLAAMQAISGKTAAELEQLKTQNPENYQQLYTTAQHFPAAMQESELGEIPEGWFTPTFEELTTAKQGKYLSKDKMTDLASETSQIPVWGGNGILGYCDTATYDENVVLITCRGSNCGLIKYTQSPSHVSNNSFACQPSIGSVWFLLTYLKNQTFSDCISGSAQPQITYTSLKTKKLTIPIDKAVCELLASIIQPNFEQILKNEAINQTLSELRDQLLPKLLSGELALLDKSNDTV